MLFLRTRRWLICGVLAFSLVMSSGCGAAPAEKPPGETQQPKAAPEPEPKVVTQEASQEIAVAFLRNSPTFRFDGIPDSLKLVSSEARTTPSSWVFRYSFQNRQAGYGDRTGAILAQVITNHQAEIIVEQGEVVLAVLDGRWDELRQRMLE